ncbi:hypothetical protein ACQZ4Z_12965 [Agrobacterium vitis]|uniref:hypothetical protein n=1 Tax=Agrobacterium vitis TaxID=373 RepID=UPI001573EB5B|nr:hypothetical protein [Agrobacterium vitis]NSZ42825.1 hypothetical protein [Agrobacterium vitis]
MGNELMAAINQQAAIAADMRPKTRDRLDLARALHADFPDFSVETIANKLDDVWRRDGLFFATVHR